MPPSVLGLDIGGANLKAARSTGSAFLQPFELWKRPDDLPAALRRLIVGMSPFDSLAVTMTGELCDCYPSKRAGVRAILDAVESATDRVPPIRVWLTDGRFVDPDAARRKPLLAAAANWLVLASFAGRYLPCGAGLLLDIGSTTADVVPLLDGRPVPQGRTDPERLRSGELVYTGVRRTPVCALLGPAVAAEVFATTLDVYLVLGQVAEDAADHGTADGWPATVAAAHARLARMLGADTETSSEVERLALARETYARQLSILREAVRRVTSRLPERPRALLVAGSGEFLARAVAESDPYLAALPILSLADRLGPAVSEAACAYALAVLAAEHADGGSQA